MVKFGKAKQFNNGLTNYSTEDYGSLAASKTKVTYNWFCTSQACCEIISPSKIRRTLAKVLKFENIFETRSKCPDCGQLLYSKRYRKEKE